MTPNDDHWSAMPRHPSPPRPGFDERDLDALLSEDNTVVIVDFQEVAEFLTRLHTFVEHPPPQPSAELAAVLTLGGVVPWAPTSSPPPTSHHPAPSRWLRRCALAFGLSAGMAASLGGVAAANDRLPDTAQKAWVRLIEAITPFEADDPRPPPRPASYNPEPAFRAPHSAHGPGITATVPPVHHERPEQPTARHDADMSATNPNETGRQQGGTNGLSNRDSPTINDPGNSHADDTDGTDEADSVQGDDEVAGETTQDAGDEDPAADSESEPENLAEDSQTQPSEPEPDAR